MTITFDLPSGGSALLDRDNDIIRIVDIDYPSPGGKEYKITLNNLNLAMGTTDPGVALAVTMNLITSLPALRGFWPGSSQLDNGGASRYLTDLSGNGQHLIHNNNPRAAFDTTNLFPYTDFNGTDEWFSDTDAAHWDIDGGEAEVAISIRGMTIGSWVYFDTTASTIEYILAKWYGAGQRAYYLRRDASGYPEFGISDDGTADDSQAGTSVIASAGWHLVVGRFDPSDEVGVFDNGTWALNTTSIPASIFNSTADLFMAGRDDGATPGQNLMDGRIAMSFLCAANVPDAAIERLWDVSRHIFGV